VIFIFFNNQNSRPSSFLFQIARGSEATLALFLQKIACHLEDFFKTGPLQGFTLKEPGMKKVFEFNHKMLRGLSMQDPQGSPTM
jgi:hypothetical protein